MIPPGPLWTPREVRTVGKPPMVSAELLRQQEACLKYREKFVTRFGEEPVEVTEAVCRRWARTFDFGWAIVNLLDRDGERAAWGSIDAGRGTSTSFAVAAIEHGVIRLRPMMERAHEAVREFDAQLPYSGPAIIAALPRCRPADALASVDECTGNLMRELGLVMELTPQLTKLGRAVRKLLVARAGESR